MIDLKHPWQNKSSKELIEHIIQRYHQPHRHLLPLLIDQAQYLETTQKDNPLCPQGLSQVLMDLYRDLLVHMEKEEIILFPLLSVQNHSYLCTQLQSAHHNHDHHREFLMKVVELTHQFTAPDNAEESWPWFYNQLREFYQDLQTHIDLEEQILFSREEIYARIESEDNVKRRDTP